MHKQILYLLDDSVSASEGSGEGWSPNLPAVKANTGQIDRSKHCVESLLLLPLAPRTGAFLPALPCGSGG